MKKIIIALMAAGIITSCNDKANTKQALSDNTVDSLIGVISQKDNELNDIMSTFNEIQDGFRQINEAEGRVNMERGNNEKAAKDDILESITFIRRTMEANKERIAKLKQQLKTSSFNADKLQGTIDNLSSELEKRAEQIAKLQKELEARDIHIAEQDKQITDLNTDVNTLASENETKARTVERQDKQLNTAWYVFGTKKELKEQRILMSGDVLKSGNFNKDYFTKIDIRVDKVIKLYSKSAKLLTSHPAGSYALEKDSQGMYSLRITDPNTFWSVSKYLVVVVVK